MIFCDLEAPQQYNADLEIRAKAEICVRGNSVFLERKARYMAICRMHQQKRVNRSERKNRGMQKQRRRPSSAQWTKQQLQL